MHMLTLLKQKFLVIFIMSSINFLHQNQINVLGQAILRGGDAAGACTTKLCVAGCILLLLGASLDLSHKGGKGEGRLRR